MGACQTRSDVFSCLSIGRAQILNDDDDVEFSGERCFSTKMKRRDKKHNGPIFNVPVVSSVLQALTKRSVESPSSLGAHGFFLGLRVLT